MNISTIIHLTSSNYYQYQYTSNLRASSCLPHTHPRNSFPFSFSNHITHQEETNKMNNGYSKIRVIRTTKSRSIDFSDLFTPAASQNPKSITNPNLDHTFKTHNHNNISNNKKKFSDTNHGSIAEQGEEEQQGEDEDGEKFGVILSRNYSVSSTASAIHKFRGDHHQQKQLPKPTLQSSVRRAFSMRKPSSVSEDYCRIHDQFDPISSPPPADDNDHYHHVNVEEQHQQYTRSKKSKKVKILKACKRFLGL